MINYEALFTVSYGLYIVSSGDAANGNGFISNSVFQVTSEPPRFAACCNKDNWTAELIKKHKVFSVSVLQQSASPLLIGKFGYQSGRDTNKMKDSHIKKGETGVPIILDDTIAYLECKLVQTFDVGTHLIFVGEVVQADVIREAEPLTYAYYRQVKKGVAPKNAPTYVDKSKGVATQKPLSEKYRCTVCGYLYDPEKGDETSGIKPGTAFKDLPDSWKCPVCGADNLDFVAIGA